jgi:imidazolonepropionase-like amidohydrolase
MLKFLLFTLLFVTTNVSSKTLIYAGKLITSENQRVLKEQTVVVNDDVIESIQVGYMPASDTDTVIDLKAATVMPGLMDMHVHLSMQHGGPQTYLQRFQYNEADYALVAANFAEKNITVRFYHSA